MARITVEDCLDHVDNRFLLVHVALQRSKELYKGSFPLVQCKNREIVTALREIASGQVEVLPPAEDESEKS
jgi:DNA-directed RNA polymerase subunit omega